MTSNFSPQCPNFINKREFLLLKVQNIHPMGLTESDRTTT